MRPASARTRAALFGLAALAWASVACAEDLNGADLSKPPGVDVEALPDLLSGTLARARQTGVLRLGFRDSLFPFSFTKDGGAPQGYSIDLCTGVAAEIGRELQGAALRIEFAPVTAGDRIDAVVSGKVDIECGSTTDNAERRKSVAFSPLIFVAGAKLMTLRGGPIRSARDLAGSTLVVTHGSTGEAAMQTLNEKYKLGATLVAAPDNEASYASVASGKAAAFVTDDVLLNGLILSHHAADAMDVVGDYLTYEPYGLMYRKDDPEMADAVRRAFAAMAADGELVATYRKWFLSPTPAAETLNLPMSPQLSEAFAPWAPRLIEAPRFLALSGLDSARVRKGS